MQFVSSPDRVEAGERRGPGSAPGTGPRWEGWDIMRNTWLKGALAGAIVVAGLSFGAATASADIPVAAGNGGWGSCRAIGGAAGLGNINSGGNEGSDIGVGDSVGEVDVYGGNWAWDTDVRARSGGGAALCGSSGGGFNVGFPF